MQHWTDRPFDFDADQPPAEPAQVDTSGRPAPTQALLHTTEGHRIAADIVFDGIDENGYRRYALKVEFDWLSLHLSACEFDAVPHDVVVIFKQPGNEDSDDRRALLDLLSNIDWIVGGRHINPRYSGSPLMKSRRT